MSSDESIVELAGVRERREHTIEQDRIAAGFNRKVQVGDFAGRRSTGVDNHHAHLWALFLRCSDALVDHWVCPGGVGTHQHDKVCDLQVLVAAGHQVFAECAGVGRHGR